MRSPQLRANETDIQTQTLEKKIGVIKISAMALTQETVSAKSN